MGVQYDSDWMLKVTRELGSISETLKYADDNRGEMIKRIDSQSKKLDDLGGRMTNVEQAVRSQSNVFADIANKNFEGRITSLETENRTLKSVLNEQLPFLDDMKFFRRVFGGGFSSLWKIALALIGSGLVGGSLVHFLRIG